MPIRWREGRWGYHGKVAIVVGASFGIGRDLATTLARHGCIGVMRRCSGSSPTGAPVLVACLEVRAE